MSVVRDILHSYRAPRQVFRTRLGDSAREDRALAVLMGACLLIFAAQWPRLSRQAFETGQDLSALLGGALFGWLFIAPLAFYAIALVTHMLARLFGARGSAYGARFALFWALLCASPLWLFWGLVAGFIGTGPALSLVGFVALLAFLMFWVINLRQAEWG